jgi:NTE family protein
MTITGLVLQGGGALGAFELGVVECLLDNAIVPDVVSGVSIGAINATVLCGSRNKDPRVGLTELWADLTTLSLPLQPASVNQRISMFGNPGMYRPRTDYFNIMGWLSFYDTGPLATTLAKHVDFKKLGPANFELAREAQAPRLILTATNLLTGRLERFDSKEMQIEPAHVRASGSLPPSFPPTAALSPESGAEQLYWDGGLFDNTPLSKVIDALQDSDDPEKTMYVVNLFPNEAPLPDNIPEVVMRMMTIAFSNKAQKDLRRAHQTTKLILFLKELDKLIEKHEDLRRLAQHPGYDALKEFAEPINIVELTNTDVNGASDFSALGISQRRRAGYDAAADKISKPRLAA